MMQELFNNISAKEKTDAVQNLFEHSAPSKDFFLMIALAVLMATFGLLTDNYAVVVGSMLIAPILYPMLGVAMGIIMSDFSLISKSFATISKAVVLAIILAAAVTLLFLPQLGAYTQIIVSQTKPSVISVAIGAVAGFAAAFALVKPRLNETLPGIAISVALLPPLATVGIGLARFNTAVFFNSLLLFIINAAGVVFTAAIVFSLMNFYVKRRVAQEVVKETERELKKEQKKSLTL